MLARHTHLRHMRSQQSSWAKHLAPAGLHCLTTRLGPADAGSPEAGAGAEALGAAVVEGSGAAALAALGAVVVVTAKGPRSAATRGAGPCPRWSAKIPAPSSTPASAEESTTLRVRWLAAGGAVVCTGGA